MSAGQTSQVTTDWLAMLARLIERLSADAGVSFKTREVLIAAALHG